MKRKWWNLRICVTAQIFGNDSNKSNQIN